MMALRETVDIGNDLQHDGLVGLAEFERQKFKNNYLFNHLHQIESRVSNGDPIAKCVDKTL